MTNILENLDLSEIEEFLEDENVTDIDWNGEDLWTDNIVLGRVKQEKKLSAEFVEGLTTKIGNAMNKTLNKHNPVLEAESDTLRFSILHEDITGGLRSISVRKTPATMRLSKEMLIDTGYITEPLFNFFENAIKAHCTIVICGLPAVGKTEFLKLLTNTIPPYERVITIEDRKEIHYKQINPGKDCVEVKISPTLDFPSAISFALSHNAKWTILSEARGAEVEYLMNNLSSGTFCLTTLHTNDVRKIPDRLANMLPGGEEHTRFINDVYDFIDIGVLITSKIQNGKSITRRIEQVGLFSREHGQNQVSMIYDDNKFIAENLSPEIVRKFMKAGIKNPYVASKGED